MKITIDTKADSAEEIKRVLNMLSSIVDTHDYANAESSTVTNAMLGDDQVQAETIEPSTNTVQDGIFGMFNSEESVAEESASQEVPAMAIDNKVEFVDVPDPEVIDNVDVESKVSDKIITY